MKQDILHKHEGAVLRLRGRKAGPLSDENRRLLQQAFLDAFALQGTVTKATQTAHIDRTIVYYWLKNDSAFANAYAEAITAYNDVIRNALHERGVVGIQKALFQKGQPVLDSGVAQVYETHHSDALLALIARARLPEYKQTEIQPNANVALTEHSLIIEDMRVLEEHVLDMLLQDLARIETEKNTYAHTTIIAASTPESTTPRA